VTAAIAGVVLLGTMTGTASAETPSIPIPSIEVEGTNPSDTAAHLTQLAVDLANGCTASDSSTCASAVATAQDALAVAVACAEAMASEAGVEPAVSAALQRVTLDCAEVVRLTRALAEFAVSVANDCTTEAIPLCQTVFDAARLGMDRAAGCLAGVLPVRLDGTDPGCASAIAMLYREAAGVMAMLTGCLYGSDMFCQQAREHAEYARDGLTGCVGQVLWLAPSQVQPVPGGGPLPCFAVLDQVVVSINGLLGQVPDLPTQITPTNEPEECSITVAAAMPTVQLSDPSLTTEHYHADSFVPSCDEPESLHTITNVQTPGLAGSGIEPQCNAGDNYVIDKVKRDGKKFDWHKIFGNRDSSKPIPWKVEETVTSELGAKITVGASAELNIWVKKVQVEVTAEASAKRSWTHTININPEVPAGREGHVASIVFTKVVEGRHITYYDDCENKVDFRRIRTPYKDYWDYWEEPYTGE